MMHRFSKIGLLVSILSVFMFPSCHKVEVFEDDPYGNFDALWTILDERYCFFEYKNIDWTQIRTKYRKKLTSRMTSEELFSALSIGMLLGSLWAKEAWGNYWSWDPKETWAVITWAGYLLYVHLRLFRKTGRKTLYVLLIMSFLALQMCWYGVNYLPAAQQSVHLYNRNN